MASGRTIDSSLYDEHYYFYSLTKEQQAAPHDHIPIRITQVFDNINIQPGMQVLDIGMGRGESCVFLARRGCDVWGLDYSKAAVKIANRFRQDLPDEIKQKITYLESPASKLPFENQKFDIVVSVGVLEHLYPEEFSSMLKEAKRVLKPGGTLILHTGPNRWYVNYGYYAYSLLRRFTDGKIVEPPNDDIHRKVHVNEQSCPQLWNTLRRSKLKNISVRVRIPPLKAKGFLRKFGYFIFYRTFLKYFISQEIIAVANT